ncbi:hypothetical protein QWY28_17195 [Nocardioides sp. SOB77]|uniref:Uncharacterized protein n=1 Tax=Nocardioides oceani TaxID=3058369 RepID=A0ABT8FJJ2_9ACTN|nr:hypothetical protein [Nocardioides oceani]MDN4174700.1 hypothetical protein [Nocardioides oceani]
MSAPDTARLRELATTLRDDYQLRGRWRWSGNLDGHANVFLSTVGGGLMYVLGQTRKGMQSAQPVFPVKDDDSRWAHLAHADEIPVFEVCPTATDRRDPRVYRGDIVGFRSPVADYLAAVDAETVLALLDRIDELEARTADERWNTAVDWLLNHRATVDEQPIFWAFVDGLISEEEMRNEAPADMDPDGVLHRNLVEVINERRKAAEEADRV